MDRTKIPLQMFQLQFLVTHLKDRAGEELERLRLEGSSSGKPLSSLLPDCLERNGYANSAYFDDSWYVTAMPMESLYFAHSDFRGRSVPKNEQIIGFLEGNRDEIEEGRFPCADQIVAPWASVMPEPLVQEREMGKFYVLDGQLRVMRHWYHRIPFLKVFVYCGAKAV